MKRLLAALPLCCAFPALATMTINIMTNGTSLTTATNWSLGNAPTASANSGSYADLLFTTPSTNLSSASVNIYGQSWDVTNGMSYDVSVNSSSAAPVLRLGDSGSAGDTNFVNAFSGGVNDAIFLTNNSTLTFNLTNANTSGGTPVAQLRQNLAFNVASGSTLVMNGTVSQTGATAYSITNVGAGGTVFNGSSTFTGTVNVLNGSVNLNGSFNGASVAVNGANAGFFEGPTGAMAGASAGVTVSNGLAQLLGNNTFLGATTVVGTLQAYGAQSLSSSSTLKSGTSNTNLSVLNLAVADNGYAMNSLSLGGIINLTGPTNGSATLTINNGGALTGTTEKKISAATNTTFVINGATLDLIGSTGVNNRNFQVIANGPVTINAVIDDNASGASAGNVGALTKMGTGTLVLTAANTYGGATTNGAGTLQVMGSIAGTGVAVNGGNLSGTGSISSPVTVNTNGTLYPGVSGLGTLTLGGGLNLAGNVLVAVNKSASPSNNFTAVSGTLANLGTATVTVTNLGAPALVLGDKFTLFNQAVQNGASMTIAGGLPSGLAWYNNLAVDGSISVVAGVLPKTTLGFGYTNGIMTFSWSGAYKLIAQTNSARVGLGTNWAYYPGGNISPVNVPVNNSLTNSAVFYGLSQ